MSAVMFHEPVFATIVESGDRLYFYDVGTTSDLTVYLDAALSTPAPQPISADSAGRFPPIYLDSTGNPPKVVLRDAQGVERWTTNEYPIDDVSSLAGEIGKLQDDVADVEGSMIQMDSRITQNTNKISQNQNELDNHESRLEVLESNTVETGRGALVRRTTVQSAYSGDTVVVFNTTDFNDGGLVQSNVITIPSGVDRVIISACVRWSQGNPGNVSFIMKRNQSNFNAQPVVNRYIPQALVSSGVEQAATITTGLMRVSPGDTFQLVCQHPLAGHINIRPDTWMNIVVVR